ncbi:MAG: GC-type dockerin domain-anchored protein [Phycisphaerales bacterium]
MLPYDDGRGPALFVGGTFSSIGGVPAISVARWGRPPCRANCDGSLGPTGCAALNVTDFTCFLNLVAAGDARANCDGGGTPPTLNVSDFICFLNSFAAGCS